MKRNIFFAITALAAAAVATGCSKADITEPAGTDKKSEIEITVTADDSAVSRTQIAANDVAWSADDRLFIAYRLEDASKGAVTRSATSEPAAIEGTKATFAAKLENPAAYDCTEVTYGGIVPAGAVKTPCDDACNATVTVPAAQTAAAGDIDHNADIMVLEPQKQDKTTTAISGGFRHIVAINKLTLKGLTNAGETLRSVTVKAEGKALAGDMTVDLTTGTEKVSTNTVSAITVTYDNAAITDGTFDVWFASLPAAIAEGETLSVDVETSVCRYTKTVAARAEGIRFDVASVNTTTINMDGCAAYEIAATLDIPAIKGEVGVLNLVDATYDAAAVATALGMETLDVNNLQYKGYANGKFVAPAGGDGHYICFNDAAEVVAEGDAASRLFVDNYVNGTLRIRPTANCTEAGTYTGSVAFVYGNKAVVFNVSMEAKLPATVTVEKTYTLDTISALVKDRTLLEITYNATEVAAALGMETLDVNKLQYKGYVNGEFVNPLYSDGHYICFNDAAAVVAEGDAASRLFVDNYVNGTLRIRPTDNCTEAGTYKGSVAFVYESKAVVFEVTMEAKIPAETTVEATYTINTVTVPAGTMTLTRVEYDAAAVAQALGMTELDVNKLQFKGYVNGEFVNPLYSDGHYITFNDAAAVVAEGDAASRLFVDNYDNGVLRIRPTANGTNIVGTYTGAVAFVYESKAVVFNTELVVKEAVVLDANPVATITKSVTVADAEYTPSTISFDDNDKAKFAALDGLTADEILAKLPADRNAIGEVRYGLVQPDGLSYNYNAGGYGFWCNDKGILTNWGAEGFFAYIESGLPNSYDFTIGLSPNHKPGTYTLATAFVYGSKWVKVEVNITVPDSQQSAQ